MITGARAGPSADATKAGRPRVRARIRRVLAIAGVVVLLMVVGVGAEWAITPPVGDAQQRVQAFAADTTTRATSTPRYPQSLRPLWSRPRTAGSTGITASTVSVSPARYSVCFVLAVAASTRTRDLPLLDVGTVDNESMTEALPALVQRGADVASTSMFNSAVRGTDRQDQVASMPMLGR